MGISVRKAKPIIQPSRNCWSSGFGVVAILPATWAQRRIFATPIHELLPLCPLVGIDLSRRDLLVPSRCSSSNLRVAGDSPETAPQASDIAREAHLTGTGRGDAPI